MILPAKVKCLFSFALSAALLAAAERVDAGGGRGYLEGQVGLWQPIRSSVSGSFAGDRVTYDPGVMAAGLAGYQFANGLRGEGEFNYRHVTMDKLTIGESRAPLNGDATSYGFMANLYYDFRNRTVVTPYLGAGVGVVVARFSNATSHGTPLWTADREAAVAYQGIGGFALRINDHTSLNFCYHHYAVPRLHFEEVSAQFHGPNLSLGIRYFF
jgi:opacity protein-like surface antigen